MMLWRIIFKAPAPLPLNRFAAEVPQSKKIHIWSCIHVSCSQKTCFLIFVNLFLSSLILVLLNSFWLAFSSPSLFEKSSTSAILKTHLEFDWLYEHRASCLIFSFRLTLGSGCQGVFHGWSVSDFPAQCSTLTTCLDSRRDEVEGSLSALSCFPIY